MIGTMGKDSATSSGHGRPGAHTVRLLQFTDTHLLADPDATLRGARTLPRLQACLAHARRHFFPADAVLVTGDIVHDEPAAYGVVDLLFGELDVPVLLVPGNHDVPDELRRRLAHRPFQLGGEWHTANGWQVLLLESWYADSEDGEGQLGRGQLEALDHALARGTEPHAFVFLHHPPVRMDSPALDELGLLDGAELCRAVSQHERCAASAGGTRTRRSTSTPRSRALHVHAGDQHAVQSAQPDFEVDDRPPGYRVIDLPGDGAIAREVAWLEGYEDKAVDSAR